MKVWRRRYLKAYVFFLVSVIGYAPTLEATSDVESAEDQLKYLRVLLVNTMVLDDLQYYARQGCSWDSEAIWFGAPSTTESGERLRYGGMNLKFKNGNSEEEWLGYFFMLTDADEVHEIERNPRSLLQLSCRTD